MPRDSMGIRTVSGYAPKQKTDAELVESCTREIKRLEYQLEVQKKILGKAEKRLEQASIEKAKQNLAEKRLEQASKED